MVYTSVKYPIALISAILWVGFICAISFMEAWLKFRAPGISVPLGLGIGRLVFNALNRVELVLSVVIIASMLYEGVEHFEWKQLFFVIPFLLLLIQTIWLLPTLDLRAEMQIQGLEVPSSNLHFYYVGMEVGKVICLLIFGIRLLKT